MSRESRKVFSILITILLLLRRVTILIAFIVTLARRKEREREDYLRYTFSSS